MVEEKELTIKELIDNIIELIKDIEKQLQIKQISFSKTQPSAMKIKDVCVNSSKNINNDIFCIYVIKKEDCDDIIYSKLESLKDKQKMLYNKLLNKQINDYKETIIYLRDSRGLNWKKISLISGFSIRHCHRIYDRK